MTPIRQTVDSLIIDTPQFSVTVPGVWRPEEKRPAENVVYCGRSDDGQIHKQFIVAGHLLTPGQSDAERKEAFKDLLRTRRQTEEEVTDGKAKVIEDPLRESGELLAGAYRHLIAEHGHVASMSRPANCYDNAFIESFWSTLKYELVYHQRFATYVAARTAIFDYIETFYNRTRLHSSLAYRSPITFESKLNQITLA